MAATAAADFDPAALAREFEAEAATSTRSRSATVDSSDGPSTPRRRPRSRPAPGSGHHNHHRGTPRSGAKRPAGSSGASGKLADVTASPAVHAIQASGGLENSIMSPSRRDLKKKGKGKLVDETLLLVERNRAMEDIQISFSSDLQKKQAEIDMLKDELALMTQERDEWKAKCDAAEAVVQRGAERQWRSFVARN